MESCIYTEREVWNQPTYQHTHTITCTYFTNIDVLYGCMSMKCIMWDGQSWKQIVITSRFHTCWRPILLVDAQTCRQHIPKIHIYCSSLEISTNILCHCQWCLHLSVHLYIIILVQGVRSSTCQGRFATVPFFGGLFHGYDRRKYQEHPHAAVAWSP